MIHYSLRCEEQEHGFDGWFRSSADFDRQAEAGLVACPSCGSTRIAKALMRPAVASGREPGRETLEPASARLPDMAASGPPAEMAEMMQRMQEFARTVRANAEHVGPRFAEEARKIHYGESAERQIYGEASGQDVRSLLEEGIAAIPLPPLPEDKN